MGLVDADIPHHLFSISRVTIWIASYGAKVTADAWNYHHIRSEFYRVFAILKIKRSFSLGRGVPINLIANSGALRLDGNDIPTADAAVYLYRSEGCALTEEWQVGQDLLEGNDALTARRDTQFDQQLLPQVGDASIIFGALVNGNNRPFQQVILMHIQLSEYLAAENGA